MNFETTWWAVEKLCVPETQWKDTAASYTTALSWLTSSFLMKMKTTVKLLHTCCGQYYVFRIAKHIAVTTIFISTAKTSDTLSIISTVLFMCRQYYQHSSLSKVSKYCITMPTDKYINILHAIMTNLNSNLNFLFHLWKASLNVFKSIVIYLMSFQTCMTFFLLQRNKDFFGLYTTHNFELHWLSWYRQNVSFVFHKEKKCKKCVVLQTPTLFRGFPKPATGLKPRSTKRLISCLVKGSLSCCWVT